MYKLFSYHNNKLYSQLMTSHCHKDILLLSYAENTETKISPFAEKLGLGIFVLPDLEKVYEYIKAPGLTKYLDHTYKIYEIEVFDELPLDNIFTHNQKAVNESNYVIQLFSYDRNLLNSLNVKTFKSIIPKKDVTKEIIEQRVLL